MISYKAIEVKDRVDPNIINNPHAGYLAQQLPFKRFDSVCFSQCMKDYHKDDNLLDNHDIDNLRRLSHIRGIDIDYDLDSLGKLTNNDIVEIVQDRIHGTYYLVVNSGSRNIGSIVTQYYQSLGCQLTGELMDQYLDDLISVKRYADRNRKLLASNICKINQWIVCNKLQFSTIHNTIETGDRCIVRSNVVSAFAGQRLIIKTSDGFLECVGRGNPNWLYSAPCRLNRSERVFLSIGGLNEQTSSFEQSTPINDDLDGLKLEDLMYQTVKIVNHWETVYKIN